MSDEDTQQETETAEVEDSTTDANEQEPQEGERDEAWDPEKARRRIGKVVSENKALRERATKAEEKAKSADEIARERDDLSTANLRLEVGYELGLPLSLARRLQGSNREELLADAESLVELVAPTKKPATRRPAEVLRGGGAPAEEPDETDTRKLGARMFEN